MHALIEIVARRGSRTNQIAICSGFIVIIIIIITHIIIHKETTTPSEP